MIGAVRDTGDEAGAIARPEARGDAHSGRRIRKEFFRQGVIEFLIEVGCGQVEPDDSDGTAVTLALGKRESWDLRLGAHLSMESHPADVT